MEEPEVADPRKTPDATVYRLSLYHCYLGELLRSGAPARITSRQLAGELGIKEETVRRDISFVGDIGRPGAGYAPIELHRRFSEFLGVEGEYPIVKVGTTEMLRALAVVFPPHRYDVKPVAAFSELPEDAGTTVEDLEVHHITDIPAVLEGLDVRVALVACSPGWVQIVVDVLAGAGITGILLLTPAIRLAKPAGVEIVQVRMPCDIKSLACRCQTATA
jgi:redox-sensing transcriptional repressor